MSQSPTSTTVSIPDCTSSVLRPNVPSLARRSLAICALVVLIEMGGSASSADVKPATQRFEMCYRGEFEANTSRVHSVTAQFSSTSVGPTYATGTYEPAGSILLEYTEWGIPDVTFGFNHSCLIDTNGDFYCGLEGPCGVGTVKVHFNLDRSIIVYTRNAALATRGRKSLLIGGEDNSAMSGLYKLKGTLMKGSLCSPEKETTTITVRRGDIGEEVFQIESFLSKLGFFHGIPDRVFDGTTAEATKTFQISRGLEVTGIVDSNTYVFLAAVAIRSGC